MKKQQKAKRSPLKKRRFTLNTRLTLVVGAVFVGSVAISTGLAALLEWLFNVSEKFPVSIQIFVFALAVLMIATRLLSKIFFDPIKALRDGMQSVTEGELDTQLTTRSTIIEIQEMIDGFNVMTKELRSTEILSSDFVSNVSHEFKTPINAIEGYTTLLQGCEELDSDAKEYAEKIFFNTQRLSVLVSNILLLSKIENQSIVTKKEFYGLDEQIRESIVALEPMWEPKNIEFDVELERIEYFGNENMMRHVFDNLIGNAIKFTDACSTVKISLYKNENNIVFSVKDEGPGISEEAAKHLFDKFYQGDTSHKDEGNGLGLALVKRIVTISGGEIYAENLEKGCRFTVILNSDK